MRHVQYFLNHYSIIYTTSSTAQGGGGSFKNRKPIGEVGCCESGMAERSRWWTERWLRSPLFLSLSLTIYLPTYLCMYLSIDLSLSLSLSSVYLSSCLPVYLSIYLSLSLSLFHVFISLSLEMLQNPHVLLTFAKVHNPLRLPRESTSVRPKVLRTRQFFALLTWKYASRHNGVHFFDIWTSKSGPRMVCFVHFDFEMCFAPQRRALFRHLKCQKSSAPGVFCAFWLGNVLRAATARPFSTSQLPKVVRTWCVLYILTSKCASRHNGVHFFRHLKCQKWSAPGVFCAFWLANVLRATTPCNFLSLIWPAGSAPAALASLLFDPPEP